MTCRITFLSLNVHLKIFLGLLPPPEGLECLIITGDVDTRIYKFCVMSFRCIAARPVDAGDDEPS